MSPRKPRPSRAHCQTHEIQLQDFGAEGKYVCPMCLFCQWLKIHETDIPYQQRAAHVDPRLYGRPAGIVRRRTLPDMRPPTAHTWKVLRNKLRRFAIDTLRVPGARQMELEALAHLIGGPTGSREMLYSLARGLRVSSVSNRGALGP